MALKIQECVLNLVEACGPQDFQDIYDECKVQVNAEMVTKFSVQKELHKMVSGGLLYTDTKVWSNDVNDF